MKTTEFYNGNESVLIASNKLRAIRQMSSTGIPKNGIKSGGKVYVAKSTLERIKNL